MRSVNFTSYEAVMRALGSDKQHVKVRHIIIAGGLTGILAWIVSYPLDFVKTLIQTDCLHNPRHRTMRNYLGEEFNKGSWRRILTGIEIMAARAFVVNSTAFFCFEEGKKLLFRPEEIIV